MGRLNSLTIGTALGWICIAIILLLRPNSTSSLTATATDKQSRDVDLSSTSSEQLQGQFRSAGTAVELQRRVAELEKQLADAHAYNRQLDYANNETADIVPDHDSSASSTDGDSDDDQGNQFTAEKAKQFFIRLTKAYHNPINLDQVIRIKAPSRTDFDNFYARLGVPIIFSDAIDSWPAKAITLESFRRDMGEQTFRMRSGNPYITTAPGQQQLKVTGRKYQNMKVSDFLDVAEGKKRSVASESPIYMGKVPLSDPLIAKMGIRYPPMADPNLFLNPTMWLGPKDSVTPLHSDARDNFVVQLVGCKHFILFSYTDRPYLYSGGGRLQWSAVDPEKPDFDKFPLFVNANRLDLKLCPGEMLYLPAGWAHHVRNLDVSLMVNYWMKPQDPFMTMYSQQPPHPLGVGQGQPRPFVQDNTQQNPIANQLQAQSISQSPEEES